ncbi:MAG: tRNA (guanosine(37)-N1)-methyltransferase TrmD [Gammaproteobacteria bacterium]|nr:tRNA (guanosine(37)-N1)-methyltransferase TrmD [Gammaproteobacteria bacterium]
MRFDIVTLFPEMFAAIDYGVVGRAKENDLISLNCWNPRDYTKDNYHKIDDSPYGGGPGMVMMVPPLQAAIQAARKDDGAETLVVYLTPQGKLLDHDLVMDLTTKKRLILVSGRYEGIDERLMKIEPGIEVSIGDYVLSGGELASMVIIDAVTRQLPGVVGDAGSVEQDSFVGGLLDYPHYTRPEEIEGYKVPAVLLSGNHAEIDHFRKKQALGRTWLKRPELLAKIELTAADRMLLNEFIKDQTSF